eukprot:g38112.t1
MADEGDSTGLESGKAKQILKEAASGSSNTRTWPTWLYPSPKSPGERGAGPRLNPLVQTRRLSRGFTSAARPGHLMVEVAMAASLVSVEDPAAPAALTMSAQRELMVWQHRWRRDGARERATLCSSGSGGMTKRSYSSDIGSAAGIRGIGVEEPGSRPMAELQ